MSTKSPRGAVPPPRFIGGTGVGRDPVVSRYTAGIAARAKAAGQASKVPIPDLAVASSQYRPEKDGPMTLGQIAQSQEVIRSMSNPQSGEPPKRSLSPETIAGLKQMHEQVAAQQQSPGEKSEAEAPTASTTPPAEKKSVTRITEDEKQRLAETSDLDFDLMMQRVRSDVINNSEERKALELKLQPMDLADGLMTGEFKQLVPIVKGKLEVMYRTITPFENEEIRRWVLTKVLEDEKYSNLHAEKYGFMQVVAAVKTLNGQELPNHLRSTKGGGREFLWDIFNKKVETFTNYPGPLIHALGVNANWFDLRVRALFTSGALKNG